MFHRRQLNVVCGTLLDYIYRPCTRGDQRGGTHTNERSHVKLITISSNGPYDREERSDLNPSISV